LLIRRVRLAPEQVSADPRSRRRRTLHPEQRALPIAELADLDAVYGYSFIVTLCRARDYAEPMPSRDVFAQLTWHRSG
jgi:hypothetical protein